MLGAPSRQRMGTPAPALIAALEEHPFPDFSGGDADTSIATIRQRRAAHLSALRHLYPIPGPIPDDVHETEHLVPARDGSSITVKIYKPTGLPSDHAESPLIVMYHEGGWCLGDLTDEDLNCRMFARDLQAVCVNVDYRLAPEHPWPTGINDAYDVLRWCAAQASPASPILPANPRAGGFIVGGASAGGNIAAALCQIARDESLTPPLTGQYLCVPALLHAHVPENWKGEYRSRSESIHDPVIPLTAKHPPPFRLALKPDATSPLYSPMLHPDLGRLPPAFFQLAGLDPLRDEGILYERVLREEHETPTTIRVYEGYGHMFWTNWPGLEASRRFVRDTLEGVRWLLQLHNANRLERTATLTALRN